MTNLVKRGDSLNLCVRRNGDLNKAPGWRQASRIHREQQKRCAENTATEHLLRIALGKRPGAEAAVSVAGIRCGTASIT